MAAGDGVHDVERALAGAPIGAAVVDAQGRVRTWNQRAVDILGWTAEEAVGNVDPSVPPDAVAAAVGRIRRLIEHPESASRAVVDRVRPDGSTVSVSFLSASVVDLEDGPGLTIWFERASAEDTGLLARNRLSRRLVSARRDDDVLPVLASSLRDLLGGASAVVLSPCPSALHLHGVRGIGVLPEVAEHIELDLAADAPWVTAAGGRLATGHLMVDGRRTPTWFVPMGPADDQWVLAVQYAVDQSPSLLDAEMAVGFADEAWIALQRASLVRDLDGKIEILEATNQIAQNVGLDLEQTVVAVSEQSAAALSCERAAIYLVDEVGDVGLVHVHASDARPSSLVEEAEGLSLAASVLTAQENLLYQDASACPVADGPWHAEAGAVSLMGLPLRVGDRTIGALVVAHTQAHPRGFTALCQQVGAAVARQAALAIEHARLYAAERETVDQLRELDRLKADWIAGLTHDLRTPLTGLLGFVQTLRRLAGDVDPADQAQYLDVMARQAKRLVRLVEDLLLTAQIDGDRVARRRELVVVPEVVDAVVDVLGPDDRDRVDVAVERETATVDGDHSHLERVVQNLVDNALRHAAERVSVVVTGDGRQVVVRVCDDGPGVPDDLVERLFDRFEHGGSVGSTGLGLYVARGIARAHGGDLELDRSIPGTCFRLTLPAAAADARFEAAASTPGPKRRMTDAEARV